MLPQPFPTVYLPKYHISRPLAAWQAEKLDAALNAFDYALSKGVQQERPV